MSLRNRARKLMRATGLTYQQALEKLRALEKAPFELRAETGWTLEQCDLHLVKKNQIEVVTIEPRTRAELACQQLLHTTGAEAVLLLDGWRMLAFAGARERPILFHPVMLMRRNEKLPKTRKTYDVGGGLSALILAVKKLHLVVVYGETVSLMLLEKRIDKAVEFLERLIEDDPLLAPPDSPDSGDGGAGGLSGVAFESVEIWKKKP